MNLLVIPNAFKGTYTASQIAAAMERGARRVDSHAKIRKIPIADGGDGTLECFFEAFGGEYIEGPTVNAWRHPIQSRYLRLGPRRVMIELATSAGLTLVGEHKNPRLTTTYGVGIQIADAIATGATEIYLAIGGSATNDMGVGMLEALGAIFTDNQGNIIHPVGETLSQIHAIDVSVLERTIHGVSFTTFCDVDNPLYGPLGAAYVYAPQKGASTSDVLYLDNELREFAALIETKYHLNPNFAGAGAAGGTSVAAKLVLHAKIVSGIDAILDLVGFNRLLIDVDAVITGEGKLDSQSFYGKVVGGIYRRMQGSGKPLLIVCGLNQLERLPTDVFVQAIHNPNRTLNETFDQTLALVEEKTKLLLQSIPKK
jgi:glycerate 2-kinase